VPNLSLSSGETEDEFDGCRCAGCERAKDWPSAYCHKHKPGPSAVSICVSAFVHAEANLVSLRRRQMNGSLCHKEGCHRPRVSISHYCSLAHEPDDYEGFHVGENPIKKSSKKRPISFKRKVAKKQKRKRKRQAIARARDFIWDTKIQIPHDSEMPAPDPPLSWCFDTEAAEYFNCVVEYCDRGCAY